MDGVSGQGARGPARSGAFVAALLLLAGLIAPPAHAGVRGDFNGDGRGDLAIGAPGEDPGAAPSAGQVTVLYGGRGGRLNGAPGQAFNQDTDGIPDAADAQDRFGAELATGDFDGDGRADLAIGAPGESVGTLPDAGQVTVLPGSAGTGLQAAGAQAFTQEAADVTGPSPGAAFGDALATGDFNADGRDDLAVGAPSAGAGRVTVLYGTPGGLAAAGAVAFASPLAGQLFGAALAAGDFNGDGTSDLAVGAPGEGLVAVLSGSAGGLGGIGWTFGHGAVGLPGPTGGAFGATLAAGDFNHDGTVDLAIGAPGAAVRGQGAAGHITVLAGSPGRGLAGGIVQGFDEDGAGVPAAGRAGDLFGAALAAGDFNHDGTADLAVGAPGATVGTAAVAGRATVLYGSSAVGLNPAGVQNITQGPALHTNNDIGDGFAGALAGADIDGDGDDDLVIGAPGENTDSSAGNAQAGAGQMTILRGGLGGLAMRGAQKLSQDGSVPDDSEYGDAFAFAFS